MRDARPYRYWDEIDRSAVRKGYEGLDDGAVEWLLSKARESKTGLVIQRFAPDDTYDPIYPEIRPDN